MSMGRGRIIPHRGEEDFIDDSLVETESMPPIWEESLSEIAEDDPDDSFASTELMPAVRKEDLSEEDSDIDPDGEDAVITRSFKAIQVTRASMVDTLGARLPARGRGKELAASVIPAKAQPATEEEKKLYAINAIPNVPRDLYPNAQVIEMNVYALIKETAENGIGAVREPDTIQTNDDLNMMIAVRIISGLYEETIEKLLDSDAGEMPMAMAREQIRTEQREEIARKLGRPAKIEEIKIDDNMAKKIAIAKIIASGIMQNVAYELTDAYRRIPLEEMESLITELHRIFRKVEHLTKAVALLGTDSEQPTNRYRLTRNQLLMEYLREECEPRISEDRNQVILQGEKDLLNGTESPEREEYVRMLEYLAMRAFKQTRNIRTAVEMKTWEEDQEGLKDVIYYLTQDVREGGVLRKELSELSIQTARITLRKIEELMNMDMKEERFDIYAICEKLEEMCGKIKGQNRWRIVDIIYEEIPSEIQAAAAVLNGHTSEERKRVIGNIMRISSHDLYSYLWEITGLAKGKPILDIDIIHSPLTKAACIIKIVMHALKICSNRDSLFTYE